MKSINNNWYAKEFRSESDFLGEVKIPTNAYFGSNTQRGVDNFRISDLKISGVFVKIQAMIKKASAMTNLKLNKLNSHKAELISSICDEIISGDHQDHFVVDIYQAGAGTSQNMNINEVISNLALERMGKQKGEYEHMHPNDDINMSQSTNDTIHTAIYLSTYIQANDLIAVVRSLSEAFLSKSAEFDNIIKSGRTHLQDALPISLGRVFSGYGDIVRRSIESIEYAHGKLRDIPLGGTAVGTGANTGPEYSKEVVKELSNISGIELRVPKDKIGAFQNLEPILELSNALSLLSTSLIKIGNDLRLLSSGPKTGIGEIELPPVQPGSSIMAGKVNPVIIEMMTMVCYQAIGNHQVIQMGISAGQLELNVMMPLIAYNILFSIQILTNAIKTFEEKCLRGIKADKARCRELLNNNPVIATLLNEYLGYELVSQIVQKSYSSNRTVREIVLDEGLISPEELDRVLDFDKKL